MHTSMMDMRMAVGLGWWWVITRVRGSPSVTNSGLAGYAGKAL